MQNQTSVNHGIGNLPPVLQRSGLAMLCLFLLRNRAAAQDILTPPPQTPAVPTAMQEHQAENPMQVFPTPEATASPYPLQWGPVTAHPRANYQFDYSTGLESGPGRSQGTVVQTVSPGVLFNLGDHWTLDYGPSLTFYSSSAFSESVDQAVHLGWGTAYGNDWFFSGGQSYTSTSDPNVQTAAQTGQEAYATALNASYQINEKMSLSLGLGQSFSYVDQGSRTTNSLLSLGDSKSWSTSEGLNYQFWPRFSVGLSAGLGYSEPTGSVNSLNEQYQGQMNWRATDKISFQLSGGIEDQQYLSGGASSLATPIFGASVQYQPFEQTQVSLSANRTVSQSVFENEVSENTAVSLNVNQRLLGQLQLSLSGSYGTSKYLASVASLSTSRNDDTYTFNARLSCPVLKRGSISVFYTYTDNSSTQSGFATTGTGYGFSSSEVGFSIGYTY